MKKKSSLNKIVKNKVREGQQSLERLSLSTMTKADFKALSDEQKLETIRQMRNSMNRTIKQLETNKIDSIRMGQIRLHYENGVKPLSEFIDKEKTYKNSKGKEIKNGHYGSVYLLDAYDEFEFLQSTLSDPTFSVEGAKQELKNTLKTIQDKGVKLTDTQISNFSYKQQKAFWNAFNEFREQADSHLYGSERVFRTIMTEMKKGDLKDLKSRVNKRLSKMKTRQQQAYDYAHGITKRRPSWMKRD